MISIVVSLIYIEITNRKDYIEVMARKASTFRIDPPLQAALENLSRVLRCPMNRLVNEALQDYLDRRSGAAERDLELTLASLRAYRRRDPHFKKAIAAAVDAEAVLGREDPAEGKVVVGKLVGGKLVDAPSVEGVEPLRAELRRLLNAS
jgi:hypothetical protein